MSSDTVPNKRLRQSLDKSSLVLMLGEVIALGLLVASVAGVYSAGESASIVLSLSVAYLIPRFIFTSSHQCCNWGKWMFLVVATLLALYVVYSIKNYTLHDDFTLEQPDLHSDDGRYYCWALSHYDGRCPEPKIPFKGLPLFMLGLWKIFGVSIVWPLALNYMFTLLSIVVTGKIADRLLSPRFPSHSPSTIASVTMLLVSLLGFFISQDVRIQKEAGCALGIVMVGYSLAGLSSLTLSKREKTRDTIVFVLGTLILALVRTNFAYFAMIGAAMMAFAHKRLWWKRGALLSLTALAITVAFSILFSYSFGQQYRTVDGGDAMALAFKMGIVQQPYLAFIGDYYHYPEWERLLLLPITAGVQYIIPFPWLYDYSAVDILEIVPRMRVTWYLVGGACIFYYLYINVVHHKYSNLGMWAWWPLATFLGIAYITGGSVSRYVLPLQPLFVVIAMYVILKVHGGAYRRSFTVWMIVYFIILAGVLVFCYHTQLDYLNSLHEYHMMKAKHLI